MQNDIPSLGSQTESMYQRINKYIIGDVQGCSDELETLLHRIPSQSGQDHFFFVGDIVNRGPESLAALRMVRGLGAHATAILGNHDLHLLAVANGVRPPSRGDTLSGILEAPDRRDLIEWLRNRPMAAYEDNCLMVHAGVLPQWSATEAMTAAGEVEAALRGPRYVDFLRELYGNAPVRWDESLEGPDRLRCIVNALTRMRYCLVDGTMLFDSRHGEMAAKVSDAMPWYEVPDRRTRDVTVAFGHWSALGLLLRPNLVATDTGCVWGGKLTAVRLQDRQVFQVDCKCHREIKQ